MATPIENQAADPSPNLGPVPSWYGPLLANIAHVFPSAPPYCFSLNTQYDLRAPVGLENTASQTSHDFDGQDFEDTPSVPSLVITHGEMGNQKIVAVFEIKPSLTITRAESDKFKGYARTLEALGQPAANATLLLIAGGFAFQWRRDQFEDLRRMDAITPEYLAARSGAPTN